MLYPSINEVRKKVDSRYTLVVLAAKRARDLIDGLPKLQTECDNDKPVSEAAYEINDGLVTYRRPAAEEVAEEVALEATEMPEEIAEEL